MLKWALQVLIDMDPRVSLLGCVCQVQRKTMDDCEYNEPWWRRMYAGTPPPPRVDPPLAIRDSLSHSFPFARPRLLARKTPRVSRRNMLARTSDTLGFGVCRAVPITPRRIPSACYLSLGTCAGDIMWESKRILRYTRFARQTSLQNLETKIWATNLNKSYITSKFGPLNGPLRYNFLN